MPDVNVPAPGTGPLAGIRILEVTHILAGPYAGMLLADLGADVIKIESGSGDLARGVGGHTRGPHNLYFNSFNRNKRAVRIDLATPAGQAQLGRLAAGARGLVTNLRPSAIRKLGLTYDALRRWNERIVCMAITGYGLDGPFSDLPSYDYVVQALTGVMTLTGDPDGPPTRVGYSVVDNTAGMMGALGLVAKVLEGRGGQIDLALHDVMLSQMNYLATAWLNAGERPRRYPDGGHPYYVPAQVFATRDGHVALFIANDRFWQRFCERVERPQWADDPRFATIEARRTHREAVVAAVGALLRTRESAHWAELLAPHGVVIAPVQGLPEALDGGIARARGMVVELPSEAGPIRAVGNPIQEPGRPTRYRRAPLLGEHDAELLGPDTAAGTAGHDGEHDGETRRERGTTRKRRAR